MSTLEQYWYRISAAHLLLVPLALLFAAISALRRWCYRIGLFTTYRLPVPVLVVGNLTVGGTGKTPLVIALVEALLEVGLKPAVICRGYGGSIAAPTNVTSASDPAHVGDEAVLLARRCRCPVWAGKRRASVACALLAAHPERNIVISDDGLQHYALARDIEVVVIDGLRGFGNRMPLPAGPLREPVSRLRRADAVLFNGAAHFKLEAVSGVETFAMNIVGCDFYQLAHPERHATAADFAGTPVHAVAAIGHPQRFFEHLRKLDIAFEEHPFPDHHAFKPSDLDFGNDATILMTEKDAVKCERFRGNRMWALRVDAVIDPTFTQFILRKWEALT